MALPVAVQFLIPILPDQSSASALLNQALVSPWYTFSFLCFSFFFTLLGKGNLIYALASTHQTTTAHPIKIKKISFLKRILKTFVLEISFSVFLFCIALIAVLPSGLSFFLFGKTSETLIFISLLVFLPLFLITFFIRQFSLYYFLLSPLTFTASYERGTALFMRYRLPSFLFGLFSFFLYGVFTFSLNLAMLGGVVLLQKILPEISRSAFFFLGSLFFLTWYAVFHQALWLHFFTSLAKPKNPLISEEGIAINKDQLSEIPLV